MSDTFIGDAFSVPTDDTQLDFSAGFGFTRLYGIGGDDSLATSIAGLAYLEGGGGDDYLAVGWEAGVTTAEMYGGSGNDWLQGGATNTGDTLYGGSGDDFVDQNDEGVGGDDYIDGGQGRDSLNGQEGDDTILGGEGDDSGPSITVGAAPDAVTTALPGLFGGDGDDYLDGGRGNDLLVGGLGFDTQVGGPGNDIFDFNSAQESAKGSLRDLILDFKKGDRIDLSDIAGGLDFIGKKGFHGEAGEIRFKKGIVQADFDGNGKAEFEIDRTPTTSEGQDHVVAHRRYRARFRGRHHRGEDQVP